MRGKPFPWGMNSLFFNPHVCYSFPDRSSNLIYSMHCRPTRTYLPPRNRVSGTRLTLHNVINCPMFFEKIKQIMIKCKYIGSRKAGALGYQAKRCPTDYTNVIRAPRATPPRASPMSNRVNELRGRAAFSFPVLWEEFISHEVHTTSGISLCWQGSSDSTGEDGDLFSSKGRNNTRESTGESDRVATL